MATEKRLIDAHDLWSDIMMLPHNGDIISSEEVEQAIKDAPTVDAVEVVYCEHCVNHGNCLTEDLFRMARIEKPYCCVGKMDGDGNG